MEQKRTVYIVLECKGDAEFYRETPMAVFERKYKAKDYIEKLKQERLNLCDYLEYLDDEYAKEIMQVPLPRSFQDEIDQYNLILFEIEEKYNANYERLTNGYYQVGFSDMFRKENTKYKIFPYPFFEQK